MEKKNKRVIALGFFDGVHIGHGALLRRVATRAHQLGAVPAAVTFDTRPKELVLNQSTPLLSTAKERSDLMRSLYGVQEVIVLPFDSSFMHMDWQEFVTDFLIARHGAVHLIAGHDFRFGYQGAGNAVRLQKQCAQSGIGCDIIAPVSLDGITVSSTYIRTLVAQGEMYLAMKFLGHPHTIIARASHGNVSGPPSDTATITLTLPPGSVVPASGVYATRIWVDGKAYSAATALGVHSSISSGQPVLAESFLLNFNGEFCEQNVRLEFYQRVQLEQKYRDAADFCTYITGDAEMVKSYFSVRW